MKRVTKCAYGFEKHEDGNLVIDSLISMGFGSLNFLVASCILKTVATGGY
jgi:hypothetical protein